MLALLGLVGTFIVCFLCGLFIAPKIVGGGSPALIMAVIIGCIGLIPGAFIVVIILTIVMAWIMHG